MIKAIVTDLDFTLLNNNREVSDYTIDILNKCHDKGLKIFIATARNTERLPKGIDKIKFDGIVGLNGSLIKVNNELIGERGVDVGIIQKNALAIINAVNHVKVATFTKDDTYANEALDEDLKDLPFIQTDFTNLPNTIYYRLLISVDSKEDAKKIANVLDENLYMQAIEGGHRYRITDKEINKATGLEILLKKFNLDFNDIVAFGDDLNDIEMLSLAKTSVTLENALDEVKSIASQITKSNDNDGVAKWLAKNILN